MQGGLSPLHACGVWGRHCVAFWSTMGYPCAACLHRFSGTSFCALQFRSLKSLRYETRTTGSALNWPCWLHVGDSVSLTLLQVGVLMRQGWKLYFSITRTYHCHACHEEHETDDFVKPHKSV